MKPSRGWMLAWIAVVCLLWNLVLQASMNPASSFEKHSVWPKESRSPSSCQSMRVLRGGWIHSRAGPQEFLFTPDVSLRAEDLDPAGPPWLESRGPPGIYRDLGRPIGLAVAKVATAAFIERSNYASAPNFPAVGRPNLKHGVLQHALARQKTSKYISSVNNSLIMPASPVRNCHPGASGILLRTGAVRQPNPVASSSPSSCGAIFVVSLIQHRPPVLGAWRQESLAPEWPGIRTAAC